jgi:hypothetical protein
MYPRNTIEKKAFAVECTMIDIQVLRKRLAGRAIVKTPTSMYPGIPQG